MFFGFHQNFPLGSISYFAAVSQQIMVHPDDVEPLRKPASSSTWLIFCDTGGLTRVLWLLFL